MKNNPEPKRHTIAALLGEIDFSPDNVVTAASVNSVLFIEAAQHRYETLSKKTAAKMLMEQITAGKDLDLRKEARANGDKTTENQIKAALTLDPDVSAATEKFNKAEEMDEYMKLVVEAFRMRRDCLQIVAGLVRNEMSSQSAYEAGAEKLKANRQKLREKFPEA